MQRLSQFITTHPRLILIVAVVLALPAGWRALHNPINYDLFSYMPPQIESLRGQHVLDKTFKTSDTAYLLLTDIDTAQILRIKSGISQIDGVATVTWLSDLVDPAVPGSFVPAEIKGLYQRGDHALLHIAFKKPSAAPATMDSYKEVQRYLNEQRVPPTMTGLPAFIAELRDLIQVEKNRSVAAAVVVAGLVVGVLMQSALLAGIFLFSVCLGALYNLGTVSGQLCYITEALAAVIQMGVTFDFAIFLTHRYREELNEHPDPVTAMQATIRATTLAILPSALTTVAGFTALSLMQLRFGADLGLTLAKGVLIGLVVTETVLPAALLLNARRIKPSNHSETHSSRIAGFIVRHGGVLSLVFVLAFIPAVYGRLQTEVSYTIADSMPDGLPSMQALERVEEAMGTMELAQVVIPTEVPAFKRQELARELARLNCVSQVYALENFIDPGIPESFIPSEVRDKFERGGYSLMTIKLTTVGGTPEAGQAVDAIRALVHRHAPGALVTGVAAFARDISFISARDIPHVNWASTGLILLIVALSFRSVSIPILLVSGIQLAIFFNLACAWVFGTSLPFITVTSIGAIQLGATVDYAILLMTRYREERQTLAPEAAMIAALTEAAPAVATSALCLFSATIGVVFVNDIRMIESMCLLIARGALISMFIILSLLPAVIVRCDGLINKTTWGVGKQAQG